MEKDLITGGGGHADIKPEEFIDMDFGYITGEKAIWNLFLFTSSSALGGLPRSKKGLCAKSMGPFVFVVLPKNPP